MIRDALAKLRKLAIELALLEGGGDLWRFFLFVSLFSEKRPFQQLTRFRVDPPNIDAGAFESDDIPGNRRLGLVFVRQGQKNHRFHFQVQP